MVALPQNYAITRTLHVQNIWKKNFGAEAQEYKQDSVISNTDYDNAAWCLTTETNLWLSLLTSNQICDQVGKHFRLVRKIAKSDY